MLTIDGIERAYDALQATRSDLAVKNEKEISAKACLATKRAELLMSGAVIGKNETAREAQLAEVTKDEVNECRIAEAEKREAALQHELASLTVGMHRDMLRLMEIEKD